jgi:alcohol dehydrogenase (cytochrome c)
MHVVRFTVCSITCGLTLAAMGTQAQMSDFEPVTDAVLENPSDADWLQWRRTYDGWA